MEVRSAFYNCLEIKPTCSAGVNKELVGLYIVKIRSVIYQTRIATGFFLESANSGRFTTLDSSW